MRCKNTKVQNYYMYTKDVKSRTQTDKKLTLEWTLEFVKVDRMGT